MQQSKTHFEQIAVETVKKIATEMPENNAIEKDCISFETQDKGTFSQKDWRQLAQRAQEEQDPQKLFELVQQLIAAFEEEKLFKLQ